MTKPGLVEGGGGAGYDDATTEYDRCAWCRRVLPPRSGPGRPRVYCSQRCRQWHWVNRQRASELELSESELIVARDALDRLHDDLYVLGCAVADTRADLEGGRASAGDLRRMLDWLLDACDPLVDRDIRSPT